MMTKCGENSSKFCSGNVVCTYKNGVTTDATASCDISYCGNALSCAKSETGIGTKSCNVSIVKPTKGEDNSKKLINNIQNFLNKQAQ